VSVQTLTIPFPSLGVVRRLAYSASPPEGASSTPWSVNVRQEDSLTKRLRGGSFVGIDPPGTPRDRERRLVDDIGRLITDDDGNVLVAEAEKSIVSGGGRVWAIPGVNAPASHPAEVVYRGRLFRVESNAILASRQGDYQYWDYGAYFEDPGRAFAIQLSEAGEVGEEPTALIPHKDAFLLAATKDSLWVMQGDPTAEGTLRNIARGVGIVGPRAWCKDHMDRVFFLSPDGFYTISASGEGLQAVSENAIPEELTGIHGDGVVLSYNRADRCVYIHVDDYFSTDTMSVDWVFDTERQQFWPFTTDRSSSHLLLGPFRLGEGDLTGIVSAVHGVIADGSAPVSWRLIVG
jgi:hypothetical protein